MSATKGEVALAVVSTAEREVVLGASGEATFGRAENAALTIGRDPIDDELVADVVGAVSAWRDCVVVSNRSPRLAFDIAAPGRPLLSLAPAESHAPSAPEFMIMVRGAVRHELRVTPAVRRGLCTARSGDATALAIVEGDVRAGAEQRMTTRLLAGPSVGAGPTIGRASQPGVLVLTERQRAVLDAYVAPLAQGLPPATHQQVAKAIGVCRQTVRLECTSIWEAFLAAGVPMRDHRDARDAIADAWARHRL